MNKFAFAIGIVTGFLNNTEVTEFVKQQLTDEEAKNLNSLLLKLAEGFYTL